MSRVAGHVYSTEITKLQGALGPIQRKNIWRSFTSHNRYTQSIVSIQMLSKLVSVILNTASCLETSALRRTRGVSRPGLPECWML